MQFQGYGGGRGLAHEHVLWALAGYAHLVIDSRGQGSGWTTGDTADPVGSGPSAPAFMTRGIDDPHEYFYRRLFVDAVRAVQAIRSHVSIHRTHDEVLATLSYFDGVSFARRSKVPALFSVGLMDTVCPPSTVYAAYNAYAGPKEIAVYPENDHEGGGPVHKERQLRWLRALLGL